MVERASGVSAVCKEQIVRSLLGGREGVEGPSDNGGWGFWKSRNWPNVERWRWTGYTRTTCSSLGARPTAPKLSISLLDEPGIPQQGPWWSCSQLPSCFHARHGVMLAFFPSTSWCVAYRTVEGIPALFLQIKEPFDLLQCLLTTLYWVMCHK